MKQEIKQPDNFPTEVSVVIEIPANSGPVKYEIDEEDLVRVDRFLPVSMSYPCNYGFIPNTLGGDGDPLDILVLTRFPVVPGAIIDVKIIGVLSMEDEKGRDEKILAVPTDKVDLLYKDVNDVSDVPAMQLKQIEHFFKHYKDLETGKFVKILGWEDRRKAIALVLNNAK